MSIAQQREIDDLKQRVAAMEAMLKQLYADMHPPKTAPGETLTLPEKRKSA